MGKTKHSTGISPESNYNTYNFLRVYNKKEMEELCKQRHEWKLPCAGCMAYDLKQHKCLLYDKDTFALVL